MKKLAKRVIFIFLLVGMATFGVACMDCGDDDDHGHSGCVCNADCYVQCDACNDCGGDCYDQCNDCCH